MARGPGLLRRLAALASLVGLLVPFVLSGHPLSGADRDCGPVFFGAHRSTEFETDVPSTGPEHCAFCHFLRAFSGAAPGTVGTVVPTLPVLGVGTTGDDRLHAAGHLGLQPARAPPSLI